MLETDTLLRSEVRVINIGLQSFARDLQIRKTAAIHVDWSPPVVNDARIADLLSKLGG
jgi:hypothetical protein